MKTTDSVMREKRDIEKKFYEDLADNEWILDDPYSPDMVQMPFHELEKRVHTLLSHSLAEARREWVEEMVKKIDKLQTQCNEADGLIDGITALHTLRSDLLTGDNPERKV